MQNNPVQLHLSFGKSSVYPTLKARNPFAEDKQASSPPLSPMCLGREQEATLAFLWIIIERGRGAPRIQLKALNVFEDVPHRDEQ